MKEEKAILIVDDGVKVRGVKDDEIIPMLVHALVVCFDKECGPINVVSAGKKIVDVLFDEQMRERVNVMWDLLANLAGEDDDDEDDDD